MGRSSIPGWGVVVRTMTIRMVWSVGVFFGIGVVVVGIVGVTTLHPRGPGDPELAPVPEVVPPSMEESSRAVCKDGDPLCTIPMKMAHESPS
jgi:hypothetical protein